MEELTQEQIDQLLETETLDELNRLATSFGLDLEGDTSWATASPMGALLAGHYSNLRGRSTQEGMAESRFVESADRDGDGELSYQELEGRRQQAVAEGDEETVDRVEDALAGLNAPEWLLQQLGRNPTPEEVELILDEVERATGQRPASVFDLEDPSVIRLAEGIAETLAGEQVETFEPFMRLPLTYGSDFDIQTSELERVLNLTGFDESQFVRTLQLADAYGLRRADDQQIAWQPAVFLMNMTGHRATGGTEQQRQDALDRVQQLREQLGRLEEAGTAIPGGAYQALKREYDKALAEWNALKPGTERSERDDPLTNLNLQGVFDRFTEGTQMYGNLETLGMLHAVDPQLAAKMWATGGDITRLSGEDINRAGYWLSQAVPGAGSAGDSLSAALVQMGYGEASGDAFVSDVLAQVDYTLNGGSASGGGGGRIRMTPDRVGIEQATKDLMEALYPTGASDEDVARIVDRVMAEAAGAPEDQSMDLNARVRRAVEELPQYEEFYGNKPGGVGDGEYRGIMEAGAASILGNEAGLTQSAGLGMRSGKYQTAVGAAAGTSAAWDNSTFLGRLARAAQVTSANT